MKENLKPCPFCGSTNVRDARHYIECMNDNCMAFGPIGNTPQQKFEAWNHRASSASILGEYRTAEYWTAKHRARKTEIERLRKRITTAQANAREAQEALHLVAAKVGGLFACTAHGMPVSGAAFDEARDAVRMASDLAADIAEESCHG